MDDDEDNEEAFGGMFENGHWIWDELTQALVFISDLPPQQSEAVVIPTKAPTGTVEFRDNVDLLEQSELDNVGSVSILLMNFQIRYRRRYQRQLYPGQLSVVTLQDVKDIALFTAPLSIMSAKLINMLHAATAERFLRALVLYIQYYLQVAGVMATRMEELLVKLRTPQCADVERVYQENLTDLRVLVAKEYSIMIIGGADLRKFHHMGAAKKRRSLADMDARLIETLLRMCVQIVWLALGRKSFNQIELEVHRLFKSETFNMVEHNLKTRYIAKMAPPERETLLGRCNKTEKKLKIRSPLMQDVFCHDVDFRMTALGVVQLTVTTPRLNYLECAVAAAEEILEMSGVSIGIIGLDRSRFDTMLNEIKIPTKGDEKSRASMASVPASSRSLTRSSAGMRKSTASVRMLYPEIKIPPKDAIEFLPPRFPSTPPPPPPAAARASTERQRRRWLVRFTKLVSAQHARSQAGSSHA